MSEKQVCAYQSKSQMEAKLAENRTVYWKSNFAWLQEHNGHRPGCVHLYVSTTGGGKSTLTRSLLIDAVAHNPDKQIDLVLTEESTRDFLVEMAKSGFSEEGLKRVSIHSERDLMKSKNKKGLVEYWDFVFSQSDLVLFDNISTSELYIDATPEQATWFCKFLRDRADDTNTPLITFAHTKKEIKTNHSELIEPEDVRGVAILPMMAQFAYVLQQFISVEEDGSEIKNSILFIKKHRNQQVKNTIFSLVYHSDSNLYAMAPPLRFETFKERFKKRISTKG